MHIEGDVDVRFDPDTLDASDFETVGTLVAYVTAQKSG